MLFITLVALSALFVAGCAAFFSIKGLIVLFAGSSLAVGVMASSLEIGKLVAASFLHTYWKDIRLTLKVYLCVAVLVLMCITSLGIFGFLTSAYQTHAGTVNTFETKIAALQSEQTAVNQTLQENATRLKTLTDLRVDQEQRVKDAGNVKAPREQAYKAIAEANEQIKQKEESVSKDRERLVVLEKEIAEIKTTMNTSTDVGSFKFIASALNTTVDQAVQYFIFALIAVFDPLAVALVLCWNKLIEENAKRKQQAEEEYILELAKIEPVKPAAKIERVQEETKVEKPQDSGVVPAQLMVEAKEEVPLDIVSNIPIADVPDNDLETNEEFNALSPEEKQKELIRRRKKTSGSNNSIITN